MNGVGSLVKRSSVVAVALWTVVVGSVAAQLPHGDPESHGMSAARLQRLAAVMEEYAERGDIAGVVTMVLRDGHVVHAHATGVADVETGQPLQMDAIFRIASQTKAVTSVAIMMLVEQGKLNLTDRVSRYLPSYANTTVWDAEADSAVPARRGITIRDLLTHTAGISYGGHLDQRYRHAGFTYWYFADMEERLAPSIDRLATLPFQAHPGERWVYGYNTDILGRVVEVASGQSLADFFQAHILDPLGMQDTHFFLPPDKAGRLAAVHAARRNGAVVRAPSDGIQGQGAYVQGPRMNYSGGAGLLSTASDYARFLQMLLNGGELDGARILSPKSVQLMTSNHVGDLYQNGNQGFGLGFWVTQRVGATSSYGSVGAYGWGGAYFSTYFVDPQEDLVAVFMAQLLPSGGLDLQTKFSTLVYQAITDSRSH